LNDMPHLTHLSWPLKRPRSEAETTISLKQGIPYMSLIRDIMVFVTLKEQKKRELGGEGKRNPPSLPNTRGGR